MARQATVARRKSVVAVAFDRTICTQLAGSRILVAISTLYCSARCDSIQASVALPHVVNPVGKTFGASAHVGVDALETITAVRARPRRTLVYVNGACIPFPPISAEAVKSMVLCVVCTRTVVLAWHGFAGIVRQIAVHASVKCSTGTIVSVDPVSTLAVVPTGIGVTLVYICFA
jgi:hypothetical protein